MLRRQGIEAYVFATAEHAFNMVKIDDKFYPVDVDSASKHLNDFFGRKDYFKIIEVSEIYSEASKEDQKKMDETYFEENEIFRLLKDLVPGYLEEWEARNLLLMER